MAGITMDKLEKALEKARGMRGSSFSQPTEQMRSRKHSDIVLPHPSNAVRMREEVLERHRVLAHHTRDTTADIFRILRTRVLQIMSQSGWRTLAITSPN